MLKLPVTILAVALAGSASAAGWRSLRIDASSETAFEQSLAAFEDKLSPGRRYVFAEALKDIWSAGTEAAQAEQRVYTEADYYRQVDGLGYDEVVKFVDPTGQTARRYRAAYNPYSAGDRTRYRPSTTSAALSPWPTPAPMRESGPNWRGGTPLFGPGPAPR
jgi:outer membrane murein-binding lipoprotein Lpp